MSRVVAGSKRTVFALHMAQSNLTFPHTDGQPAHDDQTAESEESFGDSSQFVKRRNAIVHAGSALPYSPCLLLQELSWTYGLCVSAGLLNISVSLLPG